MELCIPEAAFNDGYEYGATRGVFSTFKTINLADENQVTFIFSPQIETVKCPENTSVGLLLTEIDSEAVGDNLETILQGGPLNSLINNTVPNMPVHLALPFLLEFKPNRRD